MTVCENSINNRVIDVFCDFLHKVFLLLKLGYHYVGSHTPTCMPIGYKSPLNDEYWIKIGVLLRPIQY